MSYTTEDRKAKSLAAVKVRTCHQCGREVRCNDGAFKVHLLWCKPEVAVARFWKSVDKRGPDECWPWTAQLRWDGYGRFVVMRKPQWAHRYSWELHNGRPIPKGAEVMHSCHNPACVNPKHLSLGTHKENMEEAKRLGRWLESLAIAKGQA